MPEREPADVKNLDRYGNAPLPWSRPRDLMAGSVPGPEVAMFLSTTRPDGRPHTAGIGALWHDGDLDFTSNPDTRKSRDLAANSACTIAMRLPGIDLIFDGEAARTTDPALLEAVAALFREGGWPAQVEGDTITAPFSAPSAGPPPWHLYRCAFQTVVGVASEKPYGVTRWRFAP
jgi:Pyridoxamine 5'-phosphate oxidase